MKAIALISGGLDSTLAAKLIQEQGIEMIGLKFKIPFSSNTKRSLSESGIEIKEVNIENEFLEVIKNPRYGFGSNMNPCIDCKILMLAKAKELMEQYQAKFIITGEVLGQRPMSQNKQALSLIEKKSGLEGFLLRPLSAKLLDKTLPEKKGWVKREKLLSLSGRSRKPQLELAKALEIKNYAQPAGGCLLTDPEFAKRLKELVSHQELNMDNIALLKIGRHFRISQDGKLVVGRNEEEDLQLVNLAKENDYLFFPTDEMAGATSLGRGKFSAELIRLSCQITCRYCDLNGKTDTAIIYRKISEKVDNILRVSPLEENRLINFRI